MSGGGLAGQAGRELRITGAPTAEELAAVLALLALCAAPAGPPAPLARETAYERWRRTRAAALRRTQAARSGI